MTMVDDHHIVERLAAWATAQLGEDGPQLAREYLQQAEALGFDALLAEHRCAWAQAWADAEVVIEGGDDDVAQDQLTARFAVFHLLAAAAGNGEAAVGARGLTGHAYAGHVFWDADVFVLPALTAIRPAWRVPCSSTASDDFLPQETSPEHMAWRVPASPGSRPATGVTPPRAKSGDFMAR